MGQTPPCLPRRIAAAQVGDRVGENLLGIFSATATGRSVKRVDWLTLISRDHAARLVDGARGQRSFARQAAVNLRSRGGQQIKTFGSKLAAVLEGVSARGDGLGLVSFEGGKTAG